LNTDRENTGFGKADSIERQARNSPMEVIDKTYEYLCVRDGNHSQDHPNLAFHAVSSMFGSLKVKVHLAELLGVSFPIEQKKALPLNFSLQKFPLFAAVRYASSGNLPLGSSES
jgi:hypothetical protein